MSFIYAISILVNLQYIFDILYIFYYIFDNTNWFLWEIPFNRAKLD